MIDSIANLPNMTARPQSLEKTSVEGLQADYENFLKLLVSQIQNQDPLEPMDASTFVSQLAQLSQVEQSIQMNQKMGSIISKLEHANALSDAQLIGRKVMTETNKAYLGAEGGTEILYEPGRFAKSATVNILDSSNAVIRQIQSGNLLPGETYTLRWDGLTSDGRQASPGVYKFEFSAFDNDDRDVPIATRAVSEVTQVETSQGITKLVLNTEDRVFSTDLISIQ
jgi:flagellar basal-body rod modification protein FlgD